MSDLSLLCDGCGHPEYDCQCDAREDDCVREQREALAAYAHNAWSGWMNYLFSKSMKADDGTVVIPPWAVERWSRQAMTAYDELPEDEKISDRDEADRIITIVNGT